MSRPATTQNLFLINAVNTGDLAKVQKVLKNNEKNRMMMFQTDNEGRNALQNAVGGGYLEIAQELLKKNKTLLNKADKLGMTPLHYAAEGGNAAIIRMLKGMGADLSLVDNKGRTPLNCAVTNMHLDASRELVGDENIVNKPDSNQRRPLDIAVARGKVDMVTMLLDFGAQVNYNVERKDYKGGTPLTFSILNKLVDIAELLLDREMDVNQNGTEKFNGVSPIVLAASIDDKEMQKMLIRRGANVGNNPELAATTDMKTLVNIVCDKGQTSLHYASIRGAGQEVLGLLKNGANIDAQNERRETALFAAITAKSYRVAKGLIQYGADVTIANVDGMTPLHSAVGSLDEELVTMLITKKADVHAVNKNGQAPMHYAAAEGNGAIVEILRKAGADVSQGDIKNNSPIKYASRGKNDETKETIKTAMDEEVMLSETMAHIGGNSPSPPPSPKTPDSQPRKLDSSSKKYSIIFEL